MRKILACLLVVSLLLGGVCVSVAEEQEPEVFESGEWRYIVLEDGTVEIKELIIKDTKKTAIPEMLDGRQVTSIGESTFRNISSLISVTIPDSVRNIEDNPFPYSLVEVIVSPDHPNLATIDGVLFSKPDKRLVCCPGSFPAETYKIPQGIQIIGNGAFKGCFSMTSISIPDSITGIGNNAFSSCISLTDISIPDSVTSIGDKAFYNCNHLTTITIPESVTSIGSNAFDGCSVLPSITIPDSVTSIGNNPFEACYNLTEINVSPDHPYLTIIDGVLFSKPDKRLVCYPAAFTAEGYEIPPGVETIGESAFHGCSLSNIVIPDSVTSIGDLAFAGCKSLITVMIPEGMENIGKGAFHSCRSLTILIIPDSVISIGKDAFGGCDQLTVNVSRDSYAAQYCKDNGIKYTYPDTNDWLND